MVYSLIVEVRKIEYTVTALGRLAGVSSRTLRYYDQIGLLSPTRVSSNGYRIYGRDEVSRLQLIMFYREMDMPLNDIGKIIHSDGFDAAKALEGHLNALHAKRDKLDSLILTVENTIKSMRGEINMSDKEKFEGFKEKLIQDNEAKYGSEIREKYGEDEVNASNAKIKGMTKEQCDKLEKLSQELGEALKAAVADGNPAGELGEKVYKMHREWLCFFWEKYDPNAHKALGDMYVEDERFKAHYDEIVSGGAEFLRDAIAIHSK